MTSREKVVFLEIDQPLCSLTYGSAPCAAVLGTTGTRKCFNTEATCQDLNNYTPGTLTLRFCEPQQNVLQYGNVIPALVPGSLDIAPAAVNLGGMDEDAAALGQREVVTARLSNFAHSDHLVDPYRLQRLSGAAQSDSIGYDPYASGTFWGKWLARNPYYTTYAVRVRDGTLGQALNDMDVRHYLLASIDGPSNAGVRLTAKDLFTRIEEEKAVAPLASRGELSANITGTPSTFSVLPSGIGNEDYPASGYVSIGEEIIQFTRSGDTFTVVARGALGTAASDHNDEDLVQLVLVYTSDLAHDIVYDLLLNYTTLSSGELPKTVWDTAMAAVTELYTGYIAKPTPVLELVGELAVQAGFTTWPNVRTGLVEMVALRAAVATAAIDSERDIVADSLELRPRQDKRLSEVWVHYGQISPVGDIEDAQNYRSRVVAVDPLAAARYGTPRIREVFSRWIPAFGRTNALKIGNRLLEVFLNPPLEARFRLEAKKLPLLRLAQPVTLTLDDLEDDTGLPRTVSHAVTEIGRDDDELELRTVSLTLTPEDPLTERVIYVDSDSYNVNFRTEHDLLYAAPTGVKPCAWWLPRASSSGRSMRRSSRWTPATGQPASRSTWTCWGGWPARAAIAARAAMPAPAARPRANRASAAARRSRRVTQC